jgi:hypothetical protein
MKKYLAIAAAGGALAIGVPAAVAATQAPETANTPVQSATPTPGQSDEAAPDQERQRDGHLCPDKGGAGRGNDGDADDQGSAAPSAPTTPSAPSATATPNL